MDDRCDDVIECSSLAGVGVVRPKALPAGRRDEACRAAFSLSRLCCPLVRAERYSLSRSRSLSATASCALSLICSSLYPNRRLSFSVCIFENRFATSSLLTEDLCASTISVRRGGEWGAFGACVECVAYFVVPMAEPCTKSSKSSVCAYWEWWEWRLDGEASYVPLLLICASLLSFVPITFSLILCEVLEGKGLLLLRYCCFVCACLSACVVVLVIDMPPLL